MSRFDREDRGISLISRGLKSQYGWAPKRCWEKELTIPKTFEQFEKRIMDWTKGCVQSRTEVNGIPVRRERKLVQNNPSLNEIWNRVQPGQKVKIIPYYKWGKHRVESIVFTIQTKPTPIPSPPTPTPSPKPYPRDPKEGYLTPNEVLKKALKYLKFYMSHDFTYYKDTKVKLLDCFIKRLLNPNVKDVAFILNFGKLTEFERGELKIKDFAVRIKPRYLKNEFSRDKSDIRLLDHVYWVHAVIEHTISHVEGEIDHSSPHPRYIQASVMLKELHGKPNNIYNCFDIKD